MKGQGNPQLEDGFARIANEILDELSKINLSPYDWRVVIQVFRWTYGYQSQKDTDIKPSRIAEITGLSLPHVSRSLKRLEDMNIIFRSGSRVGFNKRYREWDLAAKKSRHVPELTIGGNVATSGKSESDLNVEVATGGNVTTSGNVAETGNKTLPELVTPYIKDSKDNYSKERAADADPSLSGKPGSGETPTPQSPPSPVSFDDWLKLLNEQENVKDRIGVLVVAFRALHPNAPKEDFASLGGQIAGITKITKDFPVILKAIWESASRNPVGSHMNYIRKTLMGVNKAYPNNGRGQIPGTIPGFEMPRLAD